MFKSSYEIIYGFHYVLHIRNFPSLHFFSVSPFSWILEYMIFSNVIKKKKKKKNANSYITKLHKNNRKNLFYFSSYISLFGKRNNLWLVICKITLIISVYLYKMATIHIFVTLENIDLTKQEYYTLQVNVHIYVVSIYKYRRLPLEK